MLITKIICYHTQVYVNLISKWIFSFSKAKLVPLSRRSLSNIWHDSDFRSGVYCCSRRSSESIFVYMRAGRFSLCQWSLLLVCTSTDLTQLEVDINCFSFVLFAAVIMLLGFKGHEVLFRDITFWRWCFEVVASYIFIWINKLAYINPATGLSALDPALGNLSV